MLSNTTEEIKLTQTVQKGGCAAKVAATELRKILSEVKFPPRREEIVIDGAGFDDAAVSMISETLAMVQTIDFFTPIVDSPYRFGQIAAANSLSDVYAMGGKPQYAMAVLAFPLATLPSSAVVEVLQGASDKMREAGVSLVGGHSIDDDTLKFGLSVTGFVHPEKIWSNSGAQPGDQLILTKALGTGTLTAALKRGEKTEGEIEEALASMSQLNDIQDVLSAEELLTINAATDITGFGLAGHAMQMAKASNVSLDIESQKLPLFKLTEECLLNEFLTKAHRTNKEYIQAYTRWQNFSKLSELVLCDPQTSGGLLLSVDKSRSDHILSKLRSKFPKSETIGTVKASSQFSLYVS